MPFGKPVSGRARPGHADCGRLNGRRLAVRSLLARLGDSVEPNRAVHRGARLCGTSRRGIGLGYDVPCGSLDAGRLRPSFDSSSMPSTAEDRGSSILNAQITPPLRLERPFRTSRIATMCSATFLLNGERINIQKGVQDNEAVNTTSCSFCVSCPTSPCCAGGEGEARESCAVSRSW